MRSFTGQKSVISVNIDHFYKISN